MYNCTKCPITVLSCLVISPRSRFYVVLETAVSAGYSISPFQIDSINIKRSLLVSKSTKHLLRRLNPIIDSLQTAGAYEKLQKQYFANCSEFELRDNWWIGISLQDAATVFYFLFVGCGSAIAILIIELFIKPFLHCKKRL